MRVSMRAKISGMRTDEISGSDEQEGVRLDVWLWATRFFKTRSLAKQAIQGGKVKLCGAQGKPAKSVRIGDQLEITRGQDRYAIEVLALTGQRGPATAAQRCYRETEDGRKAREQAAQQRRFMATGYAKPPTRPDKRARRLIRALGDIDAL
jgi:ribosome-associated heat shock protein Hsp15